MERDASQPGALAFSPPTGPQLDSLLASVSADLETIFAGPPGRPAARTVVGPPSEAKVITFVGGGPRRKNLLGPVALAVCGGALGLFALSTRLPGEAPSAAATTAVLAPGLTTPPAAASSVVPIAMAPARAEAIAPAPQTPASRPAVQPKPRAIRSEAKPQRARAALACSVRNSSACAYSALQQADRRLRRAYSRAIQAGVSRDVLQDYRARWARARRVAAESPKWALNDYKWLEKDLAEEARERRSSYR